MKKILLVVLATLLISCKGYAYIFKNCVESQTSTSFYAKYSYFSGNRNYRINLDEDKTVNVIISSLEGSLSIQVYDASSSYYEGNIDYDFDFTLNLSKGNYAVSLNANEHKGSYYFSW